VREDVALEKVGLFYIQIIIHSLSINDEHKPRLIDSLKRLSIVTLTERLSHYALTLTLGIIDKIPSNISILIQQGKNDSQAPIQQALLLQQELTDVGHPDHKLITYPDLGHAFYPSSQWVTAYGPMEPKVLEDLFGWLSDPVRDFKEITILRQQ
jgi:hypothetical protein